MEELNENREEECIKKLNTFEISLKRVHVPFDGGCKHMLCVK